MVLKEKRHLYSLALYWMDIERENNDAEESDVIIKSMEALQPHSSLKKLVMKGYPGARCQHLPPLDHLPFLKSLHLNELWNLEHISAEDMVKDFASDETMMMSAASPSTTFFPSLERLSLIDCPNLKGWWRNETASTSGVEDIEEGIGNLTLLEKLQINYCPNLASLPDQGMGRLISLQELDIWDCPKLGSLPEGMGNLKSLQWLRIGYCPNLASLPEGLRCLLSLKSKDARKKQGRTGPRLLTSQTLALIEVMNFKGWFSGDWIPTKNSYGLIVIVQQQVTKNVVDSSAKNELMIE
ncbi:hypothetical protein Prudu_005144 [Prunus dulcis]|uniref:R13L1/DRL21-like LRR repeat region domain-containing protein n=1 Tax=Prunus dulcis TaxID=3755 RepID=A0A4Y1QWX8_PRUDU|nr:hypothetical protein Prudu_005144 [Prunus dulcis]